MTDWRFSNSEELVGLSVKKATFGILIWIPALLMPFYEKFLGWELALGGLLGCSIGSLLLLRRARLILCPRCHMREAVPIWKKEGEFVCQGCKVMVRFLDGRVATGGENEGDLLVHANREAIQWPPGCIVCGGEFTRYSDVDLGTEELRLPVCDTHSGADLSVKLNEDGVEIHLKSVEIATKFKALN